jgi:hypothetical protein
MRTCTYLSVGYTADRPNNNVRFHVWTPDDTNGSLENHMRTRLRWNIFRRYGVRTSGPRDDDDNNIIKSQATYFVVIGFCTKFVFFFFVFRKHLR